MPGTNLRTGGRMCARSGIDGIPRRFGASAAGSIPFALADMKAAVLQLLPKPLLTTRSGAIVRTGHTIVSEAAQQKAARCKRSDQSALRLAAIAPTYLWRFRRRFSGQFDNIRPTDSDHRQWWNGGGRNQADGASHDATPRSNSAKPCCEGPYRSTAHQKPACYASLRGPRNPTATRSACSRDNLSPIRSEIVGEGPAQWSAWQEEGKFFSPPAADRCRIQQQR